MSVENRKPNANDEYHRRPQGNIFKTFENKKFYILQVTQANPNPSPKLSPRVRVGVNSWENDKR